MTEDLVQMQREAEARVRRMREEARRVARQEETTVSKPSYVPLSEWKKPQKEIKASTPLAEKDTEQLLLLLLAVFLLKNGAGIELIIAVLYLCL